MDFSQFDTRERAENGMPMHIKDEWTGEPISDGDKPCRVLVRGTASPSIQKAQKERMMVALAKQKEDERRKKNGEIIEDEARVMGDVHEELIKSAMPFVAGFEGVERGGKPLTASAEDVRWFLNLSFPVMGPKLDADGNAILDKEGNPEFDIRNRPFAMQVIEFANEQANALGNSETP